MQNSFMQMVARCQPNVILVEKTLSRNIQELLRKKNISFVLDVKPNHLKRISQCTDSTVTSFSDVMKNPKLKSCKSFDIEKFVEEHNNAGEDGKMPAKTLMFLKGFQRPLGCTVSEAIESIFYFSY
jgi:1-phosphatidylinositol-3-phosphate 5-kinase